MCEHLPKGLLLLALCHLSGWLGPEGCWAGTSLPSPRAGTTQWMQRWVGVGGAFGGGSSAWTGLARHFFLLIFPVGLCSSLVPWFMKLSDVFCAAVKLVFVSYKNHMAQIALGNSERGSGLWDALSDITSTQGDLCYWDLKLYFPLNRQNYCSSFQRTYYWLKRHIFQGWSELTWNHKKS